MSNRVLELLAGVTGQGKSYFVKNQIIPQLKKGKKPVIVFDRMGEYAGPRATDCPEKWPNYNGVQEYFDSIENNKGFISNGVHVIQCEKNSDYVRGVNFFHELGAPVSLIVDEAHDLYSSTEFKSAARALTNIARYGRKFDIDLIFITQRTMDVPPDVRSQFQGNVISFKQTLQNDIQALAKMGCQDPEKVLDLEPREYHIFGELPKRLNLK